MANCKVKLAGKPQAPKARESGSLDRHTEPMQEWVEERPCGGLSRGMGLLDRKCFALDDDWGLDATELQDWVEEHDEDENDITGVRAAPAQGDDGPAHVHRKSRANPTGPQMFPTEFTEERIMRGRTPGRRRTLGSDHPRFRLQLLLLRLRRAFLAASVCLHPPPL